MSAAVERGKGRITMSSGERERIVTLPRCGKCADGKHSRCEHLVTICEDLDEWECCCVVKVEPSPRRSTLQTPNGPLRTHSDARSEADSADHTDSPGVDQ